MRIHYQYYRDQGYLIATPKGIATLNDVKNYIDELLKDPQIDLPFLEIVDFSEIVEFDFGYYDTPELLSLFISLRDLKGYKGTCLIANNNLSKSMSNIISDRGRDLGIPIKTFKSLASARQYAELNSTNTNT